MIVEWRRMNWDLSDRVPTMKTSDLKLFQSMLLEANQCLNLKASSAGAAHTVTQ